MTKSQKSHKFEKKKFCQNVLKNVSLPLETHFEHQIRCWGEIYLFDENEFNIEYTVKKKKVRFIFWIAEFTNFFYVYPRDFYTQHVSASRHT